EPKDPAPDPYGGSSCLERPACRRRPMVRSQQRGGCTIVDWSLPEGEVGGVIVTVDVREQDLDPDDTRMTWCPVCHGASAMRSAETPDGRRFDLCDGCGLLW